MKTAIDIEDLLAWTYQRQRADIVSRRQGAVFLPGHPSNVAMLQRHASLGTRIDCAGSWVHDKNELHPDADAVHEAVMRLPGDQCGLVLSHGKGGTRPNWIEDDQPRYLPKMQSNGRPCVERDSGGRAILCHVYFYPDPDHVSFCRSVYSTWWDGINLLVSRLKDLSDYTVTGPEAPEKPWL